ncbi:MAG TPA: hypothetical protein DEF00_05425 [Candidatus Taylorbacteria bacterium]|nr:hypothetical protein [Candidatus Taylorbacteria bacterium]
MAHWKTIRSAVPQGQQYQHMMTLRSGRKQQTTTVATQKGTMKKTVLVTAAAMAFIALLASGCGSTQVSKAPASNQPGLAGTTHPSPEKAVPGLVNIGPKMSPQEVATKLIKGETTLAEVNVLLGPPQDAVMTGSENGQTVVYRWRKELAEEPWIDMKETVTSSLPGPFSLISAFGVKKKVADRKAQMAAVKDSFRSLTLEFDDNGKLKRFLFSPPVVTTPVSSSEAISPPSLVATTPAR